MKKNSIGIDLGTRNALCAYVNDRGNYEIIPSRWGQLSTSSVVGWDGKWVTGEEAVRLSLSGSKDVWWDIKRKVGTDFSVCLNGQNYSAQDLLVPLLSTLRENAELHLGRFINSCVLAVPACFSMAQREAIIQAANEAGLKEVRAVAEPTAAALAFGREGRFLILDFGAGTVDISAVESEAGVWQVLESSGTSETGGYDFDLALADFIRERLMLEKLDPDDPLWRTLVMEAESVKIALSSTSYVDWTPPEIGHRALPALRIEREELERLMRFFIRRVTHVVRRLWERYKPAHLLLVGGSSHIPLLREILEREVASPERLSLCAEESIAVGAALYTNSGYERLLLDVLSGDLYVIWNGLQFTLIPSGTSLPFSLQTELIAEHDGLQNIELAQAPAELQSRRAVLSSGTCFLAKGESVALICELDVTGRLNAVLQLNDGKSLSLTPSVRASGINNSGNDMLTGARRIRELKLSMTSLETALERDQQDRLHELVLIAENLQYSPEAVDIIEEAVKELKSIIK